MVTLLVVSWGLILVVALAGVFVVVTRDDPEGAEKALASVATVRRLDLRAGGISAFGKTEGFDVAFDTVVAQDQQKIPRTRIRVTGAQPRPLHLSAESLGAALLGQSDVATGDPVFDKAVRITGLPLEDLIGWLRADRREHLRRAIEAGASLSDGTWTWTGARLVTDRAELEQTLVLLLRAARVLARPVTAADLQELAAGDPVPEIRVAAMRSLVGRPDVDRDWLDMIARTEAPAMAVFAAAALGEAGRRRLSSLLRGPVALEAALALVALGPGDDLPAVERALVEKVEQGDIRAIAALGDVGTSRSLPSLREASRRSMGFGSVAEQAREAIRRIDERAAPLRGSLTLADHAGGELSYPRREPGTEE